MHRFAKSLFLSCAILLAFVLPPASGQVITLYDTTAVPGQHTNVFGPAPMLDDATLLIGPASITGMNFGFRNAGSTAEDVDAVVTFWDNMNVNATGTTIVNSGNLGSFTRHIGSILAGGTGTTGMFNLASPIAIPDNTAGVEIEFYMTGTTDPSDVDALLSQNLPTIGATADKFWSDDFDFVFRGNEAVIFNPNNPTVHANFFLRLDGFVPEPTCAAALAAGALLMGRRRTKSNGTRGCDGSPSAPLIEPSSTRGAFF